MSFPKYIRLDEQQKRRVPASAWTTVALGNSALYFAFPFNQNHNNNCTRARLIRNCKQLCVQRLLRSQSWQPPEEAVVWAERSILSQKENVTVDNNFVFSPFIL